MKFRKDGPKRLRFTRRELPYGQVRRWGSTVGNFKQEREAARAGLRGPQLNLKPESTPLASRDPASGTGEADLTRSQERESEEEGGESRES